MSSAASRALRLVPGAGDGDDDGGLTPLEQWELFMRGAGRSERTITETIGVLHRLEGLPILPRGVADIIGRAMDRAEIPGGTAHRIRHWYGSTLVGDGADLRTAQTLLRHANLNTTAIYVQVHDVKRVEAIDRLDPFGDAVSDTRITIPQQPGGRS
jgi:site-specific recombinase XerD